MKRKIYLRFLVLVATSLMLVAFLASCATTPKGKYAEATEFYDGMMDSFWVSYDLKTEAQKAELKKEVMPVLLETGKALQIYRKAQDDLTKQQAYWEAYDRAKALLLKYAITIKE